MAPRQSPRLSGWQRHDTGSVSDGLPNTWSARRPMAQHLHEKEDITNDTVAPLAFVLRGRSLPMSVCEEKTP